MAAEVQTITYLSSYLSISEPSLITLTTTPTIELVQSVLEAVVAKSKELDEVKADKLRLEVELESAVHTGESRVRGLKATVEKSLKETTELRTKIQELGTNPSHSLLTLVLIIPICCQQRLLVQASNLNCRPSGPPLQRPPRNLSRSNHE